MEPDSIEGVVSAVITRFEAKNAAREKALSASRQVIRQAANAIRSIHRGDTAAAQKLLRDGQGLLAELNVHLEDHPEIYWAGYVQDAQKEYAEAHLLFSLIDGSPLPLSETLLIEDAPYLNGLAEAASELRRYILDLLRRGPGSEAQAEEILERMDEVYSQLITVDFPDALTGGLRRTTDQLRAVLERTRGDLTITLRQMELEAALKRSM